MSSIVYLYKIIFGLVLLLNVQYLLALNVQNIKKDFKNKQQNLYHDGSNDVIPSIKCILGKKEGHSRSVICDLELESLTLEGNTYRDFCRVVYFTQHEKVLPDTYPSINAASRDKIIFSHLEKRLDNSEYLHVFHVVDMFSCDSREVKIPLGRQSFGSMDTFQKTFQVTKKDNESFDVIYQLSNLCDSGICKKSFNWNGDSNVDVCSLTKENLPFTGPVIYKNFYFLRGLNDESKYLAILVQKFHGKPVLTLLEANPEHYKTLGTFKFENHNFESENLDVDISHDSVAICLTDLQRYERTSITRCIQLDSNWNKILDSTIKLAYSADVVKVKILSNCQLALVTHEERGDYYIRKIGNTDRVRTLVLDGLNEGSGIHESDAVTNFYESKYDNLCYTKLADKCLKRACIPKKLLDDYTEEPTLFSY